MQKQNSGSDDFTVNISKIEEIIKKLESNYNLRVLLESQEQFIIEDECDKEYYDAIQWAIITLRKSIIVNCVFGEQISEDKIKILNDIIEKIYANKYRPKKPFLRLVK